MKEEQKAYVLVRDKRAISSEVGNTFATDCFLNVFSSFFLYELEHISRFFMWYFTSPYYFVKMLANSSFRHSLASLSIITDFIKDICKQSPEDYKSFIFRSSEVESTRTLSDLHKIVWVTLFTLCFI